MLHIANGHSLTTLIERARIPGETAIWADPLHEGPVPDVTPEALRAIRAAYLTDADGHSSDRELLTVLESWQRTVDESREHDEVVLWYEHDLFDQLNLIQVLDTLRVRRHPRVSLVSVNSFPGRAIFHGMGELTPDDIASLFPLRQPVGEPQYVTAREAWAAFRAEDPRALEALLAADTAALPFLAAALGRHLEEFPSTANGLSRTEQRTVSLMDEGVREVRDLFALMHVGETAFFIADLSFRTILRGLSSCTPALIELQLHNKDGRDLPRGTARLTGEGRDVLRGDADRVRLCGLDRWLGGVRLEAPAPLWRWDHSAGRLEWS